MSMPSAQGHHGYASSSQRREWHAPTNGIIDEGHLNKAAPLRNIPSTHDGVHRNGYSPGYSNGYSYERKTYNNGLGARTSATSHPILPQPALTVMAPIGAVAGADSIQAYSNSPRTNSRYELPASVPGMDA